MSQEKRWEPQSPLVTAPELPELIARHTVLVIHCGAVWNRNDVGVDERLQILRQEFAPNIGVYAMDYDDNANWDFLKETGLVSIPTLIFHVNGKQQSFLVGARGEAELREHFRKWLAHADGAPKTVPGK